MANINNQPFQGRFTSDGSAKTLVLPGSVDWMEVYNYTVADDDTQTTAVGVKYYWQRGMADGYGWETKKSNAANAAQLETIITSGGFTYVDSSANPNATLQSTITAVSNAAIPVVSNSGTNGLVAGDVVRLTNVAGAQQLGGMDFTVGYNTLTSGTFSLDYMAQIVAGTTGSFRKIKFNPLYYPRHRYITKVSSSGSSTVVTMSVTHGYKVGQEVRFKVPAAFGMTELDGLQGTITAINTTTTSGNTITVNIDSSAFTAFSFPLTAAVPFDAALVVPVGMDTAEALADSVDILSDATYNSGYTGMVLAAGANSPAGSASDVIYWRAGTSFSVDNQ